MLLANWYSILSRILGRHSAVRSIASTKSNSRSPHRTNSWETARFFGRCADAYSLRGSDVCLLTGQLVISRSLTADNMARYSGAARFATEVLPPLQTDL